MYLSFKFHFKNDQIDICMYVYVNNFFNVIGTSYQKEKGDTIKKQRKHITFIQNSVS